MMPLIPVLVNLKFEWVKHYLAMGRNIESIYTLNQGQKIQRITQEKNQKCAMKLKYFISHETFSAYLKFNLIFRVGGKPKCYLQALKKFCDHAPCAPSPIGFNRVKITLKYFTVLFNIFLLCFCEMVERP